MAILSNRGKIGSNNQERKKLTIKLGRIIFIILLPIISLYLMCFSYPEPIKKQVNNISHNITEKVDLFYRQILSYSRNLVFKLKYLNHLEQEYNELIIENQRLNLGNLKLEKLRYENEQLRKILNISDDEASRDYLAKVVSLSINPYSKNMLIKAGYNQKVKLNSVVQGARGLIGKVVKLEEDFSYVMLIGDSEFRIAVTSLNRASHGILVKQNDVFKIIYLKENHDFKIGEIIYSSGEGEVFPAGIIVGIISKVDNSNVEVLPFEKINNLGFVRVRI